MKAGWEIRPLQSLCDNFKQDIVDGPFGSELQRKDYITEGAPVLKIQNVKPFAVELKKMDYVSAEKFQDLKRHSYGPGDIVMTKLGAPLGASAIVEDGPDGIIVADLVRIRAKKVDTNYLCYHLNSPKTSDFINSMQKGTTRPRVTLSVVRELPIAVPPLAEQRRIVAILDEAFEGIATAKANAEKNLRNAREVFESHLQVLFSPGQDGWGEQTLGETYDVRDGTHDSPKYHNSGFPLITSKNLKRDGLSFDDVKLISETDYRKINERSAVHKGDVLLAMIGTIGNPNVVEVEPDFAIKNVALLKVPKGQNGYFLRHYLSSQAVVEKMQSEAKGTTQKFVGLGYLRAFPIPVPDASEQARVVRQMEEISTETDRLEEIYARKLAALEELKKSLLHRAFSGEL
ncbi:MAG: restriction endonuclease subunit S [Comamonadaceae bacterium]|jgi:type I restriction enzyme S subunit|nr:restriction endonuclease subunit S [Comamonadaceae bacterium]